MSLPDLRPANWVYLHLKIVIRRVWSQERDDKLWGCLQVWNIITRGDDWEKANSMFNEGLSLHKFAYMALPDHVIDVIDTDAIVLPKNVSSSLNGEAESNCNKKQCVS
ncbi:hypothetical protein Tco_0788815 [Tanacetum coccineum]